jgi:SAM-dependent methyltransferase
MAGLERVSVSTTAMRLRELLRCPRCGAEFHPQEKDLTCANGHDFPLADGIPVLSLPDESDAEEHQHSHQEQYYDREYGGYGSYRLDNWQQTYIARLAPLWEVSSPDAPFLDSGVGGSAYTVIEAARKGIPSIGCDISLEGMQTARRLAEAQGVSDRCLFVVCRAERLPFADAIFGGATSIAVLEHVPDDRRAIAELARVTRPGRAGLLRGPQQSRPRSLSFASHLSAARSPHRPSPPLLEQRADRTRRGRRLTSGQDRLFGALGQSLAARDPPGGVEAADQRRSSVVVD